MILHRATLSLAFFMGWLVSGAEEDPRSYVRMEVNQDGSRVLQTAWRRMDPPKGSGQPVVWLIGVCHLGELDYYKKTQRKLDGVELVLFEGVGFDGNATVRNEKRGSKVSHLQTTLAKSLGLTFQLDAIRYDRDHFRNSDIGLAELQAKLSGPGGKQNNSGKKASDPQLRAFVKMLEGDSFALTLVEGILKLFQGNPQFRAMARLVIIETIAATEGDVSKLAGASSPGMRRLFKTLIDDRNAIVARDLRKIIRSPNPPASVAIFYGAAHMIDLETRLRKKLAYRSADDTWMTVFSVNPAKAGLTAFESNLLRRLIRTQLEKMSLPAKGPKQKDR